MSIYSFGKICLTISLLLIVEVALNDPWDVDVDVHDIANEHLNDGVLVGIVIGGESSQSLLVIIASSILVAFLNLLLLGLEGLLVPSLLYVSELLQVHLRLLLDRLQFQSPMGAEYPLPDWSVNGFPASHHMIISSTVANRSLS